MHAVSPGFDRPNNEGLWQRFSARLNLSQKMLLLLILVVISVAISSLYNAYKTRSSVMELIDSKLVDQVEGYQGVLKAIAKSDPEHFLSRAREILYNARWGQDKSGYLFLVSHDGHLTIFPPKLSREGAQMSERSLENSDLGLRDAVTKVGRTGVPARLRYSYIKPGTGSVIKDSYVVPVGDYILIGGVYLDAADKEMTSFLTDSVISLLIAIVVLSLWIFAVNKTIKGRVKELMQGLGSIGRRDLSKSTALRGKDEFAEVSIGLDDTRKALAEVLHTQRSSAMTLASASVQMDSGMSQVGEAILSQRQRLETLASALEQMAGSTQEVANNAQASAADTQHASDLVSKGMTTLEQIIDAVRSLAEDMANSAQAVEEVNQGVKQIGKLTDAIDGISEQTNLLALNAAIEAARAGEQGRGFAVVADEVRQLAGHSQKTTQDIAQVIKGLGNQADTAVLRMRESANTADKTLENVEASRQEFDVINEKTAQVADHSTQIAAAAEQQSQVTEEVNRNLLGIRDSVEETERVINQLLEASGSLKQEANNMESLVAGYQLPNKV
ncbi:methyl-accepting chemotaxis protein [Gallaecimonas mangrovi]|uniref:methyl-accepting chemotaxis protein n=1 Tax=Gallaecimonas mangrovi TaxID=2291597 RepID=UPI00186850C6|nr:methyl-accepting chemotaxis protein [Gallaecimonas mangrovi]